MLQWKLTLPGLGLFDLSGLGRGGLVGPRGKNMLYLRISLSILHEILYIYCVDNME